MDFCTSQWSNCVQALKTILFPPHRWMLDLDCCRHRGPAAFDSTTRNRQQREKNIWLLGVGARLEGCAEVRAPASADKVPVWHDGLKFDRQSRASERHRLNWLIFSPLFYCVSVLLENFLREYCNIFFPLCRSMLMNHGFRILETYVKTLKEILSTFLFYFFI